ncbi:hypothetical protein PQQ51_01730, partial [Paraburkholderia xenovorans]|uniref:hypothetical protein n=1 Tax=Paraburkholderia xenovorans TaxID=36873 RepID=UPI0038B750D5
IHVADRRNTPAGKLIARVMPLVSKRSKPARQGFLLSPRLRFFRLSVKTGAKLLKIQTSHFEGQPIAH